LGRGLVIGQGQTFERREISAVDSRALTLAGDDAPIVLQPAFKCVGIEVGRVSLICKNNS
jgi:hypothetical protein